MKNKPGFPVQALALFSLLFTWPAWAETGDAPSRQQARAILDSTGVRGGIVLHLDCGTGRLTAALHAGDAYSVRGLDAERDQIREARRYIRSRGLHGHVSVAHWDNRYLPMTDNLVNLLVAEESTQIPESEMLRVLAPNGVAYCKENGKWNKRTKPWPQEIDEWTHWLHGSGNNAVAQDIRIGPPRQIQWKSGPQWARTHELRSHNLHTLVSSGGRIFAIMDEGIRGQRAGVPAEWKLIARDAFNGMLLWNRTASRSGERTLVASGDKLFTTLGADSRLTILDAATGKTLQTCPGTEKTAEILCSENTVVCRTANQTVVAADRETGEVLWRRDMKRVAPNSLVAGNGRVCCHNGSELIGMALQDGKELWRTPCKGAAHVVMYHDVVLLAGGHTQAFSAATGERLWEGPPRSRRVPGVFVADGLLWSAWPEKRKPNPPGGTSWVWEQYELVRNGYDLATGEVRKTVAVQRLITPGHHIRCYRPPKATSRYLLLNKRGVEFLDLQGDEYRQCLRRQQTLASPIP